jgi:glycosyltransferase involved in cell wall biosynthesis
MRVTVAIPAYDEVTSLAAVVAEALAELSAIGLAHDGEVLIVDDGSTDGTSALADSLASSTPNVRVIHHQPNRGFSGAMRTCFRQSHGDWIFLAPADGQSSMSDLRRFLEASSNADIVVGVRESRADHAGRRFLSRAFHLVARSLLAIPVPEFSSILLFRRSLLDSMTLRSRDNGATMLPEVLSRAHARGARLVTVVVPHFPRRSGRAKGGRLSVVLITGVELARIAVLVRLDEMRRVRRIET